jgi:hypothetical protein
MKRRTTVIETICGCNHIGQVRGCWKASTRRLCSRSECQTHAVRSCCQTLSFFIILIPNSGKVNSLVEPWHTLWS